MLRILFTAVCFFAALHASNAQGNASASASQTIQLTLYPTIDIHFSNSNNSGETVSMSFNNTDQYVNGVVSNNQELTVRSNKGFKISVMTNAPYFAYSGSEAQPQNMPVTNTLFMSVTGNTTGGSTVSSFNNSYQSLSSINQDILLNGQGGDDKKLVLAYKAQPEMGYAAGVYSVDVIYTATQP